ncbi:hypothetical protein [Nocardioides euryhalodurans]|uniref:Uncharacterized protein n=1 Tax=Nocardioides euryhalodurans TaxID=2518370 RepID=A0A4P7GJZ5_9ACTN|nr:hypothetical protein [Nocardioides euryhalodurans]QBR92084.1 hypothetical protein EXE57_07155 [Nocardioides euryhalodurans]
MRVSDPYGTTWRVTRRWLPWQRQLRGVDLPTGDPSRVGDLGHDPGDLLLGGLLLVVLAPGLVLFVLAGLELALLVALLPLVLLARVVLGRHWHVEARRGWTPVWEGEAGGWSGSARRIREVCAAIERGQLPPRTLME